MADSYVLIPFNHLSMSSKKKNYTKASKDERVKCF